jgi:hypothetical protein
MSAAMSGSAGNLNRARFLLEKADRVDIISDRRQIG